MKIFAIAAIVCLGAFAGTGELRAQAARLDVKPISDSGPVSHLSQKVQNGTKVDATAPKLRLQTTVSASDKTAAFQTTVEWYVLGRNTEAAKQAGRTSTDLLLMQSSKEAVSAKPSPGTVTSFFAFAPGQIKNGARSEGWIVRLLGPDGRLLDTRASDASFLALGQNQAQLGTLVSAKAAADAKQQTGDVDLPLEIVAKIKADAEKNWPGNPEMQAWEIKQMTEFHKSAYKK